MRKCQKEFALVAVDERDGSLEFRGKQLDKFPVAAVFAEGSERSLMREMRKYGTRVFHTVIIASVCCIALAGCGHKTPIVYVPDNQKSEQVK
jgi:hypothetical protein